jgi:hypothetical protein
VVDTNVPKIANGTNNIADVKEELVACVTACVLQITQILEGKRKLVIDDAGEIFKEYMDNLSLSGQPGLGDAFIKWISNNQWNSDKVDRVMVDKVDSNFVIFPVDHKLAKFDKSDRKFVAISLTHNDRPPIIIASDHKWWTYREVLSHHGVNLEFICLDYIKLIHHRKASPA